MSELTSNRYGKSGVRVARIVRGDDGVHRFYELTVETVLDGDFAEAHLVGDNAKVLPTDTMKNTIYALAADADLGAPERFGRALADRYLAVCPAASSATIRLSIPDWQRIVIDDTRHPHAFVKRGGVERTAEIRRTRKDGSVSSGLRGLTVMKTTGSAFEGFLRDDFTTLPDAADRILATEVTAEWHYGATDANEPADATAAWEDVRDTLMRSFAAHESRSVQHTLHVMAEAALAAVPEIARIRIVMPNLHYLPMDLTRFGVEPNHDVYLPTSEPHGRIEATVER